MSAEKRQHPRIGLSSAAVLVAPADGGFLTRVEDVSAGGARVTKPALWPDHEDSAERFKLFFIFDQDTVLAIRARMVRAGPDHLAFVFESGQDSTVDELLYESRFLSQQ
ncbi:MAG: PilZ domain-containing protein [Xanthomonadales bacterium]|nr:PilZ domain-containing protein [Xanthomonadales bacterium]